MIATARPALNNYRFYFFAILIATLLSILLLLNVKSASIGDFIQFAGAMTGAGLSIFGALHVASRQRAFDRHDEISLLHGALKELLKSVAEIGTSNPTEAKPTGEKLLRFNESLEVAIDLIKFSMDNTRIRDATLWMAMRRVQRVIEKHDETLRRERAIVSDNLQHERVRDVNLSKIQQFSFELLEPLTEAVLRIDQITPL